MHQKKLFLLDAFALIYRGYFALNANAKFNPVNSKGLDTSAILGFTNTLVEVLTKQKPTHIAVVFDTAAPTARHEDFTEYKANRDEMPDAIAVAIPYIKEILAAFKIPVIESDGYEADDIIGTLAKKAEEKGFITYMMTPDKDFGQLVSENIFIYKPGRFGSDAEILGVKEICEKFEVKNPLQVIDILGLWGDAVDNIPGIPGVGEKTAKQLIKEFGSIENLLANTDKLKGKLKERVEENKEKALMSKKLATILTNVPVEFDEKALVLEEPDKEKILEIFSELEFRTLAKRVLGQEIQSVSKSGQMDMFGNIEESSSSEKEIIAFNTLKNTPHSYIIVQTLNELDILCKNLQQQKEISFDTETTTLDAIDAELVGMSFSYKKGEAYYVPFPENKNEAEKWIKPIKSVLENEAILKIGQNLKYDILVLKNYGVEVKGTLFDTMLAHYLLEPEKKHGMDYLSETFLNYRPVSIEELIGKKGKNQGNMRDVPIELIKEYAAEDADITLQLKEVLAPKLKTDNCEKLFNEIETPLIQVLADMEYEGVNIDAHFLKEYSIKLQEELQILENAIYKHAGINFNIDSPKQLGEILFEKLKIDENAKKTKTGQYATGEDVLTKLAKKHPIIEEILNYRELRKLKSTYVDSLPEMVNKKTGRIHTSFMQAVAATGRLSSNNPNLQNIPIRTEKGRLVRKAFIPRNENYLLLSADYSQVELRIIAALSNDENMISAFKEGKDIHAATASRVFGISLENITKEMRSKAKAVNFGIIYGQSAFGLSENLGISRTEAKEIIDNYFKQYPAIKAYMDKNIQFAREKGYVETIMGRRRYLNDINSSNATVRGFAERNAINTPIQGSAADIIKKAMIDIHLELNRRNLKTKMILQVHDELVFDLYKPEKEEVTTLVKEKMEGAYPLSVPLITEVNTGENWLEAH
ncbi:MAG: DNA polymerase I [Bacteroidia bacterium]